MERLGENELDRRRLLGLVAEGGAIFALALSGAVFLLWVLRVEAADAVLPFVFQMKINTALGFVGCALSLLFLRRERPKLAIGAALAPLAIGLLTLAEFLSGIPLGIDELALRDWSAELGGFPGRPAPNAALVLAALGCALIGQILAPPGRARRLAVKFVCFAVVAIAMAAIAGYVAHSDFAIGWGTLRQMSILSAACALALGGAIMAHSWQSQTGSISRIPLWIPAMLCFAIVLFDISTPLEINAGICYMPLVFCALWFDRADVAFILAGISTLLILFGFFASPPGAIAPGIAAFNRTLATLALWTIAGLVYMTRIADQKLQRTARHLVAAQELAEMGSFEFDFATRHMRGSAAFDAMHGLDADPDRDWKAFGETSIPPDDFQRIFRVFEEARRGVSSGNVEYSFLRADGATRNAILHCELLFNDEQAPSGIIGVVRDVTELRQAAAREASIEAQLRHAQKLEALGTVAASVAHDINNTLVPMTTLLPYLIESAADSDDRQNLEIIHNSAWRARDLVREILAFSRKEEAPPEALRLDLLARDTLVMIRAGVPSGIEIVDALEPVPKIIGSKGQIYQILLNLATNAAQAIGEGAGTITIGSDADGGGGPGDGPRVHLYVADDGVGMDEETKARIFEPFFSTKPEKKGTGLGLSIVNGIVAGYGGSISVESSPGRGTRFDLHFPAADFRAAA